MAHEGVLSVRSAGVLWRIAQNIDWGWQSERLMALRACGGLKV